MALSTPALRSLGQGCFVVVVDGPPASRYTVTKRRARNGTNEHGRTAEAIQRAGAERPGRHLVDQVTNDVVTGSGDRPFADHDDDRADETAGGGDGFARVGVVSEGCRKRAGVDQCDKRTF